MLSPEIFTYVDHEGREFDAQIIDVDEYANAELMVYGGENGAWTVLKVPHIANPERPNPGAHWKEKESTAGTPSVNADEPVTDELVTDEPVTDEPPEPKAKKSKKAKG